MEIKSTPLVINSVEFTEMSAPVSTSPAPAPLGLLPLQVQAMPKTGERKIDPIEEEFNEDNFESEYINENRFLDSIRRGEFYNPSICLRRFKRIKFIIDEDNHQYIYIVEGEYFGKTLPGGTLAIEGFKGKPYVLELISLILHNITKKIVLKPRVLPEFIKFFFEHITDIVFVKERFQIKEVDHFISDVLTLRKPVTIEKLKLIEHINRHGGDSYIKKVLVSCINYKIRNRYTPSRSNLTPAERVNEILKNMAAAIIQHHNAKPEKRYVNLTHFLVANYSGHRIRDEITTDYDTRRYGENIISSIEREIKSRYIMDYFDCEEIPDIYYLIEGKPINSHFLNAYSGMTHHYYRFQYREFLKNDFYNKMLAAADIIGYNEKDLLLANLGILMQNS